MTVILLLALSLVLVVAGASIVVLVAMVESERHDHDLVLQVARGRQRLLEQQQAELRRLRTLGALSAPAGEPVLVGRAYDGRHILAGPRGELLFLGEAP